MFRLFTVKEMAKKFDVKETTVRRWIKDGKLNAIKISKEGGYKISLLDLDKFYDQHPKYFKKAEINSIKSEMQQIYEEIGRLAKRLDNLTQELINRMES